MYYHEESGYGNLVVCKFVLMRFWSSLVQQEGLVPQHLALPLVSIATPIELEVIPQVKNLLDEGLVHKSLNPCALLVSKIGIIRHQIPKISDMMNVLLQPSFVKSLMHPTSS